MSMKKLEENEGKYSLVLIVLRREGRVKKEYIKVCEIVRLGFKVGFKWQHHVMSNFLELFLLVRVCCVV